MTDHAVVGHEDWIKARTELLAKEKEFTRARDELNRFRRELPWEPVEEEYVFEGRDGPKTLADLFEGRSQLVVYHFMFAPEWEAGCRGCSFWADSFNGAIPHLTQRDVSFVAISRAPLEKLQAFAQRMGWTFKWVSSAGNDFNYDFQVSFRPEDLQRGTAVYNYAPADPGSKSSDMPGFSVFQLEDAVTVYHTYSTFARGLDPLNVAYQILDLVPKGRDEAGLPHPMSWVKLRDQYEL